MVLLEGGIKNKVYLEKIFYKTGSVFKVQCAIHKIQVSENCKMYAVSRVVNSLHKWLL